MFRDEATPEQGCRGAEGWRQAKKAPKSSPSQPSNSFLYPYYSLKSSKGHLSFISVNPSVGGELVCRVSDEGGFWRARLPLNKNSRRASHKTDRSRGWNAVGQSQRNHCD